MRMVHGWYDHVKKEDDWTDSYVHPISKAQREHLQSLSCPNCFDFFHYQVDHQKEIPLLKLENRRMLGGQPVEKMEAQLRYLMY